MTDGSDSAEKILQAAPKQSRALRYAEVLRNWRFFGPIDVTSPGAGVRIRTAAEPWIQIELQVIVRVDQAGQDKVAFQIQNFLALRSLAGFAHGLNLAAANLDIQRGCFLGPQRNSRAPQNHGR